VTWKVRLAGVVVAVPNNGETKSQGTLGAVTVYAAVLVSVLRAEVAEKIMGPLLALQD
jgi:hypothetical protein